MTTAPDPTPYDASDDYDDDYDEGRAAWTPRSFCDRYVVHAPHTYTSISGATYRCNGATAEDLAYEDEGTCVHGLSASLCAGPGHYPMD